MSHTDSPSVRTDTPKQKGHTRSKSSTSKTSKPNDLIRLISVSFKEATLDSPTFRASVNHLHDQVNHIELWMDGYIKLLRKIPNQLSEMQELSNAFFDQTRSPYIDNGLLDQDFSVVAIRSSFDDIHQICNELYQTLRIDEWEIIEPLQQLSKNEIKIYKEKHRNFESIQLKYDQMLARYSSQSKTKEPSSLREDAFQLFEIRKLYTMSSLDLCISISLLSRTLDTQFITIFSNFWRQHTKSDLFKARSNLKETEIKMGRISAWSEALHSSIKGIKRDILAARKQIEESATEQYTPSREIHDHDPTISNESKNMNLEPGEEPPFEKHGWLFMKTTVGKPSRTIWVRRWAFVKNGLFGLLMLSPTKTYVQETGKIGVLLCNIKISNDEERRYCFEMKTSENTLILQAETFQELRSWIIVINAEKKRAIESDDNNSENGLSFTRYPPLISEFSATVNTSVDIDLSREPESTSEVRRLTLSGKSQVPLRFLLAAGHQLVDSDAFDHDNDISYSVDVPLLNTPTKTAMTRAAIFSHAFLTPTTVPTAMTANIWGSVNWGLYYLLDRQKQLGDTVGDKSSISNTSHYRDTNEMQKWAIPNMEQKLDQPEVIAASVYPSYYPQYLKNSDIQLKALFENAVDANDNEYVLVSFPCLWSPNPKQDLTGRCFITPNNLYLYINNMGFVSLAKKPLDDLISIEGHSEKDWDVLQCYDISGFILVCRLFLDNGKLIREQVEMLISNKASDEPKDLKGLIDNIEHIKRKFSSDSATISDKKELNYEDDEELIPDGGKWFDNVNNLKKHKTKNQSLNLNTNIDLDLVPAAEINPDEVARAKSQKPINLDFTKEMDHITCTAEFNLPSRALFHIIFGDRSPVFKKTYAFTYRSNYNQQPWKSINGHLERELSYDVYTRSLNNHGPITRSKIANSINYQKVEINVQNKCYIVYERRASWQLPIGNSFQFINRFVITSSDKLRSRLTIWSKVECDKNSNSIINKMIQKIALKVLECENERMAEITATCAKKLGSHGRTLKAIRFYGHLGTVATTTSKNDKKNDTNNVNEKENNNELRIRENKVVITKGSILKMFFDILYSFSITFISSFIKLFYGGIKIILKNLYLNRFLIILLFISIFYNIFLSGKTLTSYWITRQANHMMDNLEVRNPDIMQRAIYLEDVKELIKSNSIEEIDTIDSKSSCFKKFQNESFLSNYGGSDLYLDQFYGDESTKNVFKGLRSSYRELGIKRNELLVNMRIINQLEKELALMEWRNWLLSEINKCDFVKEDILNDYIVAKGDKRGSVVSNKLLQYCRSCEQEYNFIMEDPI